MVEYSTVTLKYNNIVYGGTLTVGVRTNTSMKTFIIPTTTGQYNL